MFASREKQAVIFSLVLTAATLAFYNPIIHNQFVDLDDVNYILENPHVQAGLTWSTVKWSFTTFYTGNWHPLTWLSHTLDCQIFRLNPLGHHYVNLLLHAASAVLLFLLLRTATGLTGASWVVAALFALHPVNVESVAWAAERKNVLSMVFFLLALYAYDRYVRTGRRALYAAVAVLFALGLMAKPQVVTLPFVLLLWDYWPLERMARARATEVLPGASGKVGSYSFRSPANEREPHATPVPRSFSFLLWEKWPLFVLAAADSVVTIIAQRSGNSVRTLAEVPLHARLENVLVSYVRYLGMAFWPSRLVPLYPHPNGLPLWQVAAAALVLVAITVLVLRYRDRRYLAVGWFWFLGTLVPMIGILTVGEQAMADRYAYLPYIGLFIALVWGMNELASAHQTRRVLLAGPAILILAILGCLTYRQLGYWHDKETLWRYTLRVTQGNYVAHNNLALILANSGRADEAIVHFEAARRLHKYPPDQIVKLGLYELRTGHPQEAVETCKAALAATSNPQIGQVAWTQMGRALLQLRRYDEAAESYRQALRLTPDAQEALIGSGLLGLRSGDLTSAVAEFSHAAKVSPSDVNFLLLAQALRRSGQPTEAGQVLAQAQKISTDLTQAQVTAADYLALVGLKPL